MSPLFMDTLSPHIITFFLQLAEKNAPLIASLEHSKGFDLTSSWCTFTLPVLFAYLQKTNPVFADCTYQTFRKTLFNSPINEQLKRRQAEIVISENRQQVDQSTYALVWYRED